MNVVAEQKISFQTDSAHTIASLATKFLNMIEDVPELALSTSVSGERRPGEDENIGSRIS
ncbi:MAG: hypothetical protein MEP57_07600 [Microvirga sp.]|nr:hypothetical protein [Microvirga sp.]